MKSSNGIEFNLNSEEKKFSYEKYLKRLTLRISPLKYVINLGSSAWWLYLAW